MRKLLLLLTDIVRAAAPTQPGLAFAPAESILAAALGGAASNDQRERLRAAVSGCLAGDLRALADLADHSAPITARPEAAAQIDRVATGLADLLALRAALQTPQASVRLQIHEPALFEALHYLELPPATDQPHMAVVGLLAPKTVLTPRIPLRHPILSFISVSYDANGPGPLLSITIGSGNQQSWDSDRTSWRQPEGEAGDLRLRRREISGSVITRRLTSALAIERPPLHLELHPIPHRDVYVTTVRDERSQPLCVFFQAYPSP